jgi:hypothetical protein
MNDQPLTPEPEKILPAPARLLGPSIGSILTRVGTGVTAQLQKEGAAPVIENTGLPRMADVGQPARVTLPGNPALRLRPTTGLMGTGAPPAAAAGPRMDPLPHPEALGEAARATAAGRGDQAPRPDVGRVAGSGESYLRILVTVTGNDVQITHIDEVDGPLGPPEPLYGGLAYEVTLGDRALRVGAIPDPGVRRAFASAPAPPAQQKHFFATAASYDFTARVPKTAVTATTMPQVHIAVLALDPSQVVVPAGDVPLVKQFPHLAQEVTRLPGIDVAKLAEPVRAAFAKALG